MEIVYFDQFLIKFMELNNIIKELDKYEWIILKCKNNFFNLLFEAIFHFNNIDNFIDIMQLGEEIYKLKHYPKFMIGQLNYMLILLIQWGHFIKKLLVWKDLLNYIMLEEIILIL